MVIWVHRLNIALKPSSEIPHQTEMSHITYSRNELTCSYITDALAERYFPKDYQT